MTPHKRHSRGMVMPMILGVVALLAVLAAAITQSARSGLVQVQAAGDVQNLYVQLQLVRTKILKCSFDYPGGNNGTGFRPNLPAASLAEVPVIDLTCPGAPADAASLWNGRDAVFLPNPPAGFSTWKYRNDATSARISIQAQTEPGVTALSSLLGRFSAAEAALDSSTRTLTLIIQT